MSSRHPDWCKPYTPKKCSYPGCEYVPGTRQRQIRHMETVHEKKETFTCPSPGCKFHSHYKVALTTHRKTVHLKMKRRHCHVCPYRTDSKNTLRQHMNVHLKSGHSIETCDHCRVHLSFTPGLGRAPKDPDALRKRQCHLCGMMCQSKIRLMRHMRTHVKDGHRVKSCDYCVRNFADLPHSDPAGRPVVAAATPARRKRKRNWYDENSSSGEEEYDPSSASSESSDNDSSSSEEDDNPSSSSSESSDDDDGYDDGEDADSGKGQSLAEVQSPSTSTSRRSCPYPKWDKHCHVCGKKYDHKNHLRHHMLSHKEEGHDIDHCDHCLTNLAWTQRKGVTPKDSLDIEKIRGKANEKRLCIATQLTDGEQSDSSENESQSADHGQEPDKVIVKSGHVEEMNNEHEDVSSGSEWSEDAQEIDGNKSCAAHAEMSSEEAIMYQKCALFCRSLMSGCESLDRQAAGDAVTIPVSDETRGSDEGKDEATSDQKEQMREEADEVELNDDHELNDNNPVVDPEEAFPHDNQEFRRYADEEGTVVYHEERKEFVELSSDGETLLITIMD